MFASTRDVVTYISAALNCKRGATAIEYGLIAAGISVAIVTVVGTVGTGLSSTFTTIAGKI
ncbi:MAG: Flp family type IVb pilin [Rhodospirillaceae bacterium]